MTGLLAEYPLHDGFVHNWLVAGPRALTAGRAAKAEPVLPGGYPNGVVEAQRFRVDGTELVWNYVRALDDHLLDLSAGWDNSDSLETWAYCQLDAPAAGDYAATLRAYGPAEVWLGSEKVAAMPDPRLASAARAGGSRAFSLSLQAGANVLAVRLLRPAGEARPNAVALQLVAVKPNAAGPQVRLPVATTNLEDRADYEAALDAAYLERDAYVRDQAVILRWSLPQQPGLTFTSRFQRPDGRIYAEGFDLRADLEQLRKMQEPNTTPDGLYQVLLIPDYRLYHSHLRLRVSRALPVYVGGGEYARTPMGDFATRRVKALQHAARRENDLFAEIAKTALAGPGAVQMTGLQTAVDTVSGRRDGYALALLGIIGLLVRYGGLPGLPPEARALLEAGVLAFDYGLASTLSAEVEHAQSLLVTVAEILAGQLWPEQVFSTTGQNGHHHQTHGEEAVMAWLRDTPVHGQRAWDSAEVLQDEIVALTHLVAFSAKDELASLAAVALDQRLFSLALNSFQGTFGSTHGRTNTLTLKSGRSEPTAGVSWLLWGLGTLNHTNSAVVCLASFDAYEPPPILQAIAADQPDELWSREGLRPKAEHASAEPASAREVNKVTYRTPDSMLCSAQSYAPGEPGSEEHIWQATLGPDATVFVNHPACLSQADAFRPNFWRGNAALPRVAQWRDTLAALYSAAPDDGLGFTHAYFPVYAFDEYRLVQGWAFARQGDGYLALTAANGLALTTQGDGAYRELRSPGRANAWLCQMGRAVSDGSFSQFQSRVLALDVVVDSLECQWTSLRGDTLAFAWIGPLMVNGQEQSLRGFERYDNPYAVMKRGASQLEIIHGEQGLRLNFD